MAPARAHAHKPLADFFITLRRSAGLPDVRHNGQNVSRVTCPHGKPVLGMDALGFRRHPEAIGDRNQFGDDAFIDKSGQPCVSDTSSAKVDLEPGAKEDAVLRALEARHKHKLDKYMGTYVLDKEQNWHIVSTPLGSLHSRSALHLRHLGRLAAEHSHRDRIAVIGGTIRNYALILLKNLSSIVNDYTIVCAPFALSLPSHPTPPRTGTPDPRPEYVAPAASPTSAPPPP
jgi:hypothetical protein